MKRLVITLLVGLVLLGCYCKRCQGQSADLVIDATEAAEFRQTVLDIANEDPAALADILFVVATGNKLPSATQTVTVNQAQANRWFALADTGSFANRAWWKLGLISVDRRKTVRAFVYDKVSGLAVTKISNEAKRNRFLTQLQAIHQPEVFE